MVEKRLRDGRRIAQLIASEVHADATLSVVDADPDVKPTADGAFAYAVARGGNGGGASDRDDAETDRASDGEERRAGGVERIAEAYVQPDRVRVELLADPATAAEAAESAGLRVRPKAVRPPRTLAFVEDGARAKRVLPVVRSTIDAESESEGGGADSA